MPAAPSWRPVAARDAAGSRPDRLDHSGRRVLVGASLVLPTHHRLHRAGDFRAALRGRKAGSPLVVVYACVSSDAGERPARVGFTVSRAVGSAVVRNRVKRRLRHLVRARLSQLDPGTMYVVRATPASATATYAELGQALDRCLTGLSKPRGEAPSGGRR